MKSVFALASLLVSSVVASPFAALERRATVSVHFTDTATTSYGENIFIVGSIPALGNWSPSAAVALNPANYPKWDVTIDLPASTTFQYKFIRKESDGSIIWEVDPNRSYTTGSSGSENSVSTFNGQRSSSSSSSSRSSSSSSSSSRSSSSASSSSSSRASSSSSSSSAQPSASGTVSATFSEQATTYFGENIYLVGSISALGNWNTNNALLLSSAKYPVWSVNTTLPAKTTFQFKFFRKAPDGSITWENDPNRQATTPASGKFTYSSSFNGPATSSSSSSASASRSSSSSASRSSSSSVSSSSASRSSSSSSAQPSATGTVSATFSETATTYYGENIYLVGSISALGNWNPNNAILLSSANYPTWSKTLSLPASTTFQFKFIRKGSDGSITWENDPNRQATTPASGKFNYSSSFNGPASSSSSSSSRASSSSSASRSSSASSSSSSSSA